MTKSNKKQIITIIITTLALISAGYIANLWIFTKEPLVTKILISAVLYVAIVVSAIAIRLINGEDGGDE